MDVIKSLTGMKTIKAFDQMKKKRDEENSKIQNNEEKSFQINNFFNKIKRDQKKVKTH